MNPQHYQILQYIARRMRSDPVIKAYKQSLLGHFATSNPKFRENIIEELRVYISKHYPQFFPIILIYKTN